MALSDEEAKAAQEIAKTTGEIVRSADGIGSYLARVVGSIPENLLGLAAGDWLDHKRRRHLAVLEANTARILESISTDLLTEPSPSILIPLLKAAVDEGREELQQIWAALLANAMADGGRKVRRDYFGAVSQMEPSDALVLEIYSRRRGPFATPADLAFIDDEFRRLNVTRIEQGIACRTLYRLGCLGNDDNFAVLTDFGHGLMDACRSPK
jgi:hypothetical protein